MRALLAATLLTLFLAPAVAEPSCLVTACVDERESTDGSCETGGTESRATSVSVGAVVIEGSERCWGTVKWDTLVVKTPLANATWESYTPGAGTVCRISVDAADASENCPLRRGPPNPGWGRLLP